MSRFALHFIYFCLLQTFSFGLNLKHARDLNYVKLRHDLEHVFLGRSSTNNTLCCASGRWEANAFVFANTILTLWNTTMPVYYNGTGKIAFDGVNKKSYISFSVTEFLPGEPKHYQKTWTTIKDFVTGISYIIDNGTSCLKLPESADMKIICIPDSAKQISVGKFGNTNVVTYQFSDGDRDEITTASVIHKGDFCETTVLSYVLVVEYSVPEQFVYDVEVVDISEGIKDPSIFMPPKNCN